MIIIKKFKTFLLYFFKAKWKMNLPKKNKFVLFDGQYNPFLKYIKKKNFTILYRRGEEINLNILIRCFFKLKFTSLDYCVEFIKQVSPKLILTAFDYYTLFYKLSNSTGIHTLMIQKGKRAKSEGIVHDASFYFPKNSKKIFSVNHMLVFCESVKKFYSNKIRGKFYEIGSFENNFTKINLKKQKKQIIFISNYSKQNQNSKYKSENEDIIALQLFILAKKNNLKFNILPRFRNDPLLIKEEIKFYKKKINFDINFILNKKKSSYDILSNYKYIFASYSTIAQECLVKGCKVGFIMFKSKNNPAYDYRFGYFEKLKKYGLFWTSFSKLNQKEIARVFNYVIKTNYNKWINETKKYSKKIMSYDYKNKQFKKILKKYI